MFDITTELRDKNKNFGDQKRSTKQLHICTAVLMVKVKSA